MVAVGRLAQMVRWGHPQRVITRGEMLDCHSQTKVVRPVSAAVAPTVFIRLRTSPVFTDVETHPP